MFETNVLVECPTRRSSTHKAVCIIHTQGNLAPQYRINRKVKRLFDHPDRSQIQLCHALFGPDISICSRAGEMVSYQDAIVAAFDGGDIFICA